MRLLKVSFPLFIAIAIPANVMANSCQGYPSEIGAVVTPTPEGPKVISTAQISVPFDDADEVVDAYGEARIEAKAQISDFLNSKVTKECKRNTKKFSNSIMSLNESGEGSKRVDITKAKEMLCSSIESTSSLLRGVTDVGRCYTPGKFVMVTIGIKPSTVAEVNKLNNYMSNRKVQNQQNGSSGTAGFNAMPGYSSFDSSF